MREACLVLGVLEATVGRPPVAFQHAAEAFPEDAVCEAMPMHDEVAVAAGTRKPGGVRLAFGREPRRIIEGSSAVLDEPTLRLFGVKEIGDALSQAQQFPGGTPGRRATSGGQHLDLPLMELVSGCFVRDDPLEEVTGHRADRVIREPVGAVPRVVVPEPVGPLIRLQVSRLELFERRMSPGEPDVQRRVRVPDQRAGCQPFEIDGRYWRCEVTGPGMGGAQPAWVA